MRRKFNVVMAVRNEFLNQDPAMVEREVIKALARMADLPLRGPRGGLYRRDGVLSDLEWGEPNFMTQETPARLTFMARYVRPSA